MGVSFFIGPFDPILWKDGNPDPAPHSDLRIDPDIYSQKLLERWPFASGGLEKKVVVVGLWMS